MRYHNSLSSSAEVVGAVRALAEQLTTEKRQATERESYAIEFALPHTAKSRGEQVEASLLEETRKIVAELRSLSLM